MTGDPYTYYKLALQYFAGHIGSYESIEFGDNMQDEESEDKLKQFILEEKKHVNERFFYYEAGQVCQFIFSQIENKGYDELIAAAYGLSMFEEVIGLPDINDRRNIK